MKLTYEITDLDYMEFNLHHLEKSKTMKRNLLIIRFTVPIIFLVFSLITYKHITGPYWFWYADFGVLSTVWCAFFPRFLRKAFIRNIKKVISQGSLDGIVGTHRLLLMKEGIVDQTDFSETKYARLERIEQSKRHIYLYVSEVMAYIVPLHAFKNETEKTQFIDNCQKYAQ